MLDDLRKIIESEMEYDDINDLLMEATDNAIADMFIEEDGEAVMNDEEVLSILNKIPEYDEEAAMNKKLERLAEAYIPEELSYVEEGFISKRMLKKYSKEDLEEKIAKLEEEISELEGKEDRDKKDEKRLAKAKKELADIKDFMEKNFVEVQESCKYDDEEYLEEGFFDNLKEKRAKKKAEKADKKAQREMERSVVVSEKELPKMEKEFETTVKFLVNLLKKEVPGAEFINDNTKNVSKRTKNLKDGIDEHMYSLKIFQMDDDNYDKYKSKSKYEELRNADNAWDYMDELLQDNHTRIFDPIKAKGFDDLFDDGSEFVKEKNKNPYIHIYMGDEATFDIDVYMHFIVKKESVQESYECDDEEYLDFLYEALEPEYVEEGFKELLKKLKRTFTENGRAANAHGNHLKNIRKGLINELNTTSSLDELKDFKKWVEDCANDPNLKAVEDKDLKDVIDEHIKWLNKFLNKIDKKINKAQKNDDNVQESYDFDEEDLDFLYEAFGLKYLKGKK